MTFIKFMTFTEFMKHYYFKWFMIGDWWFIFMMIYIYNLKDGLEKMQHKFFKLGRDVDSQTFDHCNFMA